MHHAHNNTTQVWNVAAITSACLGKLIAPVCSLLVTPELRASAVSPPLGRSDEGWSAHSPLPTTLVRRQTRAARINIDVIGMCSGRRPSPPAGLESRSNVSEILVAMLQHLGEADPPPSVAVATRGWGLRKTSEKMQVYGAFPYSDNTRIVCTMTGTKSENDIQYQNAQISTVNFPQATLLTDTPNSAPLQTYPISCSELSLCQISARLEHCSLRRVLD